MVEKDPADLRLLESEQRYQAVIENASDMIQSVRPDGTFEFVNRSWADTLGYTADDVAGMTVWDIIHPDSLDHCRVEFSKAIGGQPLEYFTATFVTKDGRAVPVEGNATSRLVGDEVVATHTFIRDITERLHAQELEERNARLERDERAMYLEKMAALGKLAAGLAHELNNPAAAVQRANAGLRETIERRDRTLQRLTDAGLTAEGWRLLTEVLDEVQASAAAGPADPVAVGEAEEAIESWLESRGVDRAWEHAATLSEAGFAVADLERIAACVPAPVLADAIDWTSGTLALNESAETIAQGTRRIDELVQAIKGYSHMDRATERDTDIHDGLDQTLVILAHRLKDVDVAKRYDRSLPPLRVYGNTLNQVWTNILDNAIDAVGGKGRIAITTRSEDGRAVVEIEDDGVGIPAESLRRIFEPFFTSKPQGQGTGLGLDVAWRIVTKEHAGTISAESEPGRTVFRVSLPIAPPA
ncbi:two-component system sensor histidine kinase NtrB [Georgenia subflava]|nr:ATP-binding protein [Georgenia subflava]